MRLRRTHRLMRPLGPFAFASALALLAACSAEDRSPANTSAGAQNAAAGSPANGASGHGGASASEQGAAGTPPVTASGADASTRDAETTPATDAAAGSRDAGSQDAGDAGGSGVDGATLPCAVDAGTNGGCTSHLCTATAGTFLVVQGEQPFTVGALGWVASLCERPIDWPSAASADNRTHVYELTPGDVNEIQAGTQVLVYYANPDSAPMRALACSFETNTPLPACPATTTPPLPQSMRGCRGPADPGCAGCKVLGQPDYRSASGGSDWYNVSSVDEPEECAGNCPACATCSYRDELESRDLPVRTECEPCDSVVIDACFNKQSCECWCEIRDVLRERCPTLVP